MRFRKGIWFILLGLLFFCGCKSHENIVVKRKGELKNIHDSKLIKATKSNFYEFESLFYKKFHAEISFNGEKNSFKGNLYINRNKEIIISIFPLMGIELFRFQLMPDSLLLMDRTKKTITYGDYSLLWNKLFVDMDFTTVQSVLTNSFFCYPMEDNIDDGIKKYKHYIRDDVYTLKSIKDGKFNRLYRKEGFDDVILHEFEIFPESFKIGRSYIRDFNSNSLIDIKYSFFKKFDERVIPTKIEIEGKQKGKKFNIAITFNQIEIDGDTRLKFKYSDKYTLKPFASHE
ncbi:DUF4292 domain-containing protein [Marinilabiliaceae bacterium JC017]|nr:DUF4292 domain-containing protein [Marinilabiliaceae bacterium JC017]